MTPLDFHIALMAYCYATHASVTGGGRTSSRNAAVGGHPKSYHLTFQAADVVYDNPKPPAAFRRALAKHLGLKLVIEGTHDHLQPQP